MPPRPRRPPPRRSPANGGSRPAGGRARPDPRTWTGERAQRSTRPERPQTAAQKRAAEVRAQRGPRPERQPAAPPPWERETWEDEGPIRREASKAARRAQQPEPVAAERRRRKPAEIAPEVAADVGRTVPSGHSARYEERLASAAEALDRGRFADARRMVQPVLRDLPRVAFAHEIAGLASYSLGQWRAAAAELELARRLDGSVQHHAVLADCYRALRRYDDVEQLWSELKAASPAPALLAEGRIVAAGARADQGDLAGALRIMAPAASAPRRPRDHHLRQWYVLGDLYDRSGDVIAARRFFTMVHEADDDFADVAARLRALGG